MSGGQPLLRLRVEQAITEAATSGVPYRDILTELSTALGKFVASGSPHREKRVELVKASMTTVAATLERHH